jgi:NAD(P)-dependent dehydrogenase (short-subunit alcohol dehydrogenase family)
MGQLTDKVTLVTGAGHGIGRGIAELFVAEGATVIAVSRTASELEALAATMADASGEVVVMPGDLTDEAFIDTMFEQVKQQFGRLDVLVNNAGIAPFGSVETLAVDDVRRCMELNVVAAFNCMSQAVRLMKANGDVGKIINIGSVRSHWTEFGDGGAYNASKAGIRHMTESIARQLHGSGSQIAVSTVCPGVVDTPLTNPERKDATGWLKVEHIARSVLHVATAPPDVNVFDVVVIPMAQAPW